MNQLDDNPYASSLHPAAVANSQPTHQGQSLVWYLLLVLPPLLRSLIVASGYFMGRLTGGGPVFFGLQLIIMSVGAVVPALVLGVHFAIALSGKSLVRFVVFTAVEVVLVILAWQQTFTTFDHWP